jgi:hypothetical protein
MLPCLDKAIPEAWKAATAYATAVSGRGRSTGDGYHG